MGRRYEMFQLQVIPATITARVQYEIKHEGSSFNGDEVFRIVFAEKTLERLY